MPITVDTTIALTNLADAKAFLKITASTEDSIVSELINSASSFANRYTKRQLIKKTWTEYYDGHGGRDYVEGSSGRALTSLVLRNYPLISVASIYDDPLLAFGNDTLIDASNYALNKIGGMVKLNFGFRGFFRGRGNIKITYDAGYDPTAIPYDLKDATQMIVMSWYKNFYQYARAGLQTETQGDRTTQTRDEAVPKAAMSILDLYKAQNVDTFFSHE